jgi:hypothetical protein
LLLCMDKKHQILIHPLPLWWWSWFWLWLLSLCRNQLWCALFLHFVSSRLVSFHYRSSSHSPLHFTLSKTFQTPTKNPNIIHKHQIPNLSNPPSKKKKRFVHTYSHSINNQ